MARYTAIYVRVSSKQQDTKSQEPDLQRWEKAQDGPVRWFQDKASGKSMDRPGWRKLEEAIRTGKASQLVVWRLDRLGRTASGLTALFDELRERKVNLVSIKDGLDLSTSAGRLMANVLASVASTKPRFGVNVLPRDKPSPGQGQNVGRVQSRLPKEGHANARGRSGG